VRQRIVRIGELVEDQAFALVAHLLRDVARHFHASALGGQDDLRAECGHRLPALDRQVLGHHEDHAITHHRRRHRKRDAGIAAGRLDQSVARLDIPALLRAPDHRQGGPVLDRARRVVALQLGEDDVAVLVVEGPAQALQPDERRIADEIFEGFVHEWGPVVR
jgi:hypothetical protein